MSQSFFNTATMGNFELSPELRGYCKTEGMDPTYFATQLQHAELSPSKQRRVDLFQAVEHASVKGLNLFFDGLTQLRGHTPNIVPTFPWEQWYFSEYGGDIKKPDDWHKKIEEGVNERKMFILHLQSFGVPEKTLLSLADQATTEDNRKSFLDFNKGIQTYLGEWLDQIPAAVLSKGILSGTLASIGQRADLAPYASIVGTLSSQVNADSSMKAYDINNRLRRVSAEFALLLRTHYRNHERPLASFREISNVDQLSDQLFIGNLARIQDIEIRANTAAILAGYVTAQFLTADSPQRLATNAIETAVASVITGYFVYVMRKESLGDWTKQYVETQSELITEAERVSRQLLSERGRGINVDLFDGTAIPEKREALVKWIQESNVRVKRASEGFPWYLALGRSGLNALFPDNKFPLAAGAFIDAAVIVSAVEPFFDQATRDMQAHASQQERERLGRFVSAIDNAEHHVPTYLEFTKARSVLGLENVIDSYEDAVSVTKGHPLIIHHLDVGSNGKTISVCKPIELHPGISVIKAASGVGKSELLRMISFEQGNVENIQITKGVDLRQIDPRLLSQVVYHVEAVDPSVETTIAEQMASYAADKDDNLFKETISKVENELGITAAAGFFLKSDLEKGNLLKVWVEKPFENILLTMAFLRLAGRVIPKMDNLEEAAEYLQRKPGAMKGTSTGEGQRFEIFKALLRARPVLLLDEPTGNLEGETPHDESSFALIFKFIQFYLSRYPDTVMIVASNDPRFEKGLISDAPEITDRIIKPKVGDKGKDLVWESEKFVVSA